ncbi:hypothetical protein BSL78_05080 [Apostichopus japonicus]|uniref:Uncharacterized protein n=1 Tax=Stichopus japonicus TaxID=307972 RepID=A0A2G8LCL8_STIJA|nr:hypothetical protein BSL78_05080 [Apostichopus japonicus]
MYFNRICLLLVLFGVIYVHGDDGGTVYTAGREDYEQTVESLVKCAVGGDENLAVIAKTLVDYGCHCRLDPEKFLNSAHKDLLDQTCMNYYKCLKVLLGTGFACESHNDIYSIPARIYYDASSTDAQGCNFGGNDFCNSDVLNDDECAKAACSYCDVPKMTNLRDYMSTYVALEPKTAYDAVSGCQEDIWYQCIKNNAGKIIAVTSADCPPVT